MADDDDSNHPLGAGLASILRMTGINVPSRAVFVGEAMVSASFSSLLLGMLCGAVGASAFPLTTGPLVPYMVGSSVGYMFGMVQYWKTCTRTTLWYARYYPTVLAHAIRTDRDQIMGPTVPESVVRASLVQLKTQKEGDEKIGHTVTGRPRTLEQWIRDGGLGRMTWSVLAAQQCRVDIQTIQRQERQRVVDGVLDETNNGNE